MLTKQNIHEIWIPLLIFILLLVLSVQASFGATLTVNKPGVAVGGTNYSGIQTAITAAQPGDAIAVHPGLYTNRFNVGRKLDIYSVEPRAAVCTGGFFVMAADVRIAGFTLRGIEANHAITLDDDFGHRAVIEGNLFEDCRRDAVFNTRGSNGALIRGNRVYRCQFGFDLNGDDIVLEDNEVERLWNWGNGDCDYSRAFGRRGVIRNNWFHGTAQSEIGSAHVDGIQYFDNNNDPQIGWLIEGNRIEDCHQAYLGGASLAKIDLVQDNVFRRNVVRNCWAFAFGSAYSRGTVIKGNTFDDAGGDYVFLLRGATVEITGNIIAGTNGRGAFSIYPETVYTVRDNFYAGVRAGQGAGSGDLSGDPLFVDRAGGDYRLQTGSPAAGRGAFPVPVAPAPEPTPEPPPPSMDERTAALERAVAGLETRLAGVEAAQIEQAGKIRVLQTHDVEQSDLLQRLDDRQREAGRALNP